MSNRWVLVLAALALVVTGVGGGVAAGDSVDLEANLTGAQEVPPADPDGEGEAKVEIDVAGGNVCFEVKFDKTGTPNRGHIHRGAAGVNGPIVVAFFDLHTADTQRDARHDLLEEGELEDCVAVADQTLLADIIANPGNYYVNLHNARFPGGAIRCQLEG